MSRSLVRVLGFLLVASLATGEREEALRLGEPEEVFRTDGGRVEQWQPDNQALRDANVASARFILKQRGLFLPKYSDSAHVGYVEEGEGIVGVLSGYAEGSRTRRVRRGDVVAIPRGVASWWYNNGNEELRIVGFADTSASENGECNAFFLAGGGRGEGRRRVNRRKGDESEREREERERREREERERRERERREDEDREREREERERERREREGDDNRGEQEEREREREREKREREREREERERREREEREREREERERRKREDRKRGGRGQGEEFTSVLHGFRREFLAEAWDLDESRVDELLDSQRGSAIVLVEREIREPEFERMLNREEGRSISRSVERADPHLREYLANGEFVFNVREGSADVRVRDAGFYNSVNRFKLPILRALDLGLTYGRLENNAILAPQWSPTGHEVVHILKGSGNLQVVGHNGEQIVDREVREGEAYVIPRFHAHGVQAGNEGLEWISFYTTDQPLVEALAGRTSVLRRLPEEVAAAAFNIDVTQVREARETRREEEPLLLSAGQSRRERKHPFLASF